MKRITKILIVLGVILAIIVAVFTTIHFKDKAIADARMELRKEIIKNDSLQQLTEVLYTKRVADTLKIGELKRLSDSLKLQLSKPKVVGTIKIKPKDQKGDIDVIVVKDSTFSIEDHYPNKENAFVSYFATVDTKTEKGVGEFKFTEFSIDFGITENKDGTYSLNTAVPEYMKVNSISVQSLPMAPTKIDNFGILLGAGVGKDFNDNSTFLKVGTDFRFKKTYIGVEGTTNRTISTGIKFEF